MPRFLGIWHAAPAATAASATEAGDNQGPVAQHMTKIVDHFADVLPSSVFFIAFMQLVSRICDPSTKVCLKTTIISGR